MKNILKKVVKKFFISNKRTIFVLKIKSDNNKEYKMEQFNLKSILEEHNIDTQEIAKELFPRVKYPKEAFNRVLRGEANLDTDQVQVLAAYAGVMPADLFRLDSWKGSTEDGLFTLVKGEYKVKINYRGSFITIFKNASEVKQEVISSSTMSITQLIEHIDNLIKNI